MTASDPRAVIEEIRAEHIAEQGSKAARRAERLTKRLSSQLYPSDVSFFRELLQNADDSAYSQGEEPTARFVVGHDGVTLFTNEVGFSESNVRAICDIDASDKSYNEETTGEKGLGFKSVFAVTDRPEVHSGEYHFRFSALPNAGYAYFTPEWIDGQAATRGTRFFLPFKTGFKRWVELPRDLEPDQWVMLFLRRLRCVRYNDIKRERSLELRRSDEHGQIILRHSDCTNGRPPKETAKWFRPLRHPVDLSAVNEESRKGRKVSAVTVAVPVSAAGAFERIDSGIAYATLPVESTRFGFMFDADFVTVTNRHGLQDIAWNRALCDGVGACLANAIMSYCRDEAHGALALSMVARPGHLAQPMYHAIFQRAIEALKVQACIPTATGKWVLPSEAILPDPSGLSRLVDPAHLARRTGKHLVAPAVEAIAAELKLLGLEPLSFARFARCLEDHEWISNQPAEWFRHLYATLGRSQVLPEQLSTLKRARILRMSDGTTRSVDGERVFRGTGASVQYGFESSMPLLAPGAHDASCDSFLERIGVRNLTPKVVIDEFILPRHKAAEGAKLSDDELLAHACYVHDHLSEYARAAYMGGSADTNIRNLRVLTQAGTGAARVSPSAAGLYLGGAFRSPHRLEELWGSSMPERFVSARYAAARNPGRRDRDWHGFFERLGAITRPGLRSVPIAGGGGLAWREESKSLLRRADGAEVARFLVIVAQEWKRYEEEMARSGLRPAQCEFVQDLRAALIASSQGRVRLDQCLLDTTDNRAVFGDERPYLQDVKLAELFGSDDFADACGIVTRPSVERALARLRELSASGKRDAPAVTQVTRIYRYLADRCNSEVVAAFSKDAIVLAGHDADGWIRASQACWSTGESLGEHCPLRELKPRWRDFREFFLKHLAIPESPTPESWLEVLRSVARSSVPFDRAQALARRAYLALARALDTRGDSASAAAVCNELKGLPLLLCKDGRWRRPAEAGCVVVFADDPELEKLFAEQAGVAFIALEDSDRTDVRPLFQQLGVQRLRKAMRVEVPESRGKPAPPQIIERLRDRIEVVARFLYHQYRSEFDSFLADGLFEFLNAADVRCTPSFRVSIGGCTRDCVLDARLVAASGGTRLYLHDGVANLALWNGIGIAIASEFRLPTPAAGSICTLLGAESAADARQVLRQWNVPELSAAVVRRLPSSPGLGSMSPTSPAQATTIEGSAEPTPETASQRAGAVHEVAGERPPDDVAPHTQFADTGSPNSRCELPMALASENPIGSTGNAQESGGIDRPRGVADEGLASSEPLVRVPYASIEEETEEGIEQAGDPAAAGPALDIERDLRGWKSSRRIIPRERQSFAARAMLGLMPADDALIAEVEAAAVAFVMAEERRAGREPVDRNTPENPDNAGFDIESRDPRTHTSRFIEVKGTKNEWGEFGVAVTPTQVHFALAHGDAAWLYVVECALDEGRRKCYRIQNFATKIEEFVVGGRLRRLAE
jgi:hypothetical protein